MKVKALVPNLGFNNNQVGDIVELELTNEQADKLASQGYIELVTEKKPAPKKAPVKSKPKE